MVTVNMEDLEKRFNNVERKIEYLINCVNQIPERLFEKKTRDKQSQTGTNTPETGTRIPEIFDFGTEIPKPEEQKMEELIPWTEPWKVSCKTRAKEIELLKIKPMGTYPGFNSRYVLRPLGPTKLLIDIIRFILTDPINQNFHVKAKRAYIYTYNVGRTKLKWFHVTAKQFHDEFRVKILECYCALVLEAHPHFSGYATEALTKCIVPMTNQLLEKILGGLGPFPSWSNREKTRKI
jgi:hypothetical protein